MYAWKTKLSFTLYKYKLIKLYLNEQTYLSNIN